MRTCLFDIESTHLKANFGHMICAVVKEYHRRRPCIYIVKGTDDKKLCVKLRNKLEKYDIIVGHYSKKFDVPFLNTRLFLQGEQRKKKQFHLDTCFLSRAKFALNSNRLDMLAKSMELDVQKTGILPRIWNDAALGDDEAIKYVVDHCVKDVLVLEKVYSRMLELGFIDTIRKES